MLTTLAWSAGPELPEARTDAVAFSTGSTIRVFGGDALSATASPTLTATGTAWTTGFDIDTQRNDLGAAVAGGSIILFGGTGNTEGSDEVLAYDAFAGDSQDLEKLNSIRYDLGYAADGAGRVYALGGIGVYDDGEIWSSAERYSASSDTWTEIASLPEPLHGLSAIGDGDGSIFVFGGSTTLDDSGIQRTSYQYDIATDAWSEIAPMPAGTRDSAVTMDHTGAIYVLGGMTTAGATDAVQVYDPATNSWSAQTALPEPIYSHAAAFDSLGRIVVVGGFDSSGTATADVSRTQRLTIAETAPVFTTSGVTGASLDTFYTYDANANGNPAPQYSLVNSPTGMSIDETSGLISWQPVAGQEGIHSVTVRASNVVGDTDQTFDISVAGDTIAPTVPSDFTFTSATASSVTFDWSASTDASGVDHYEVSTALYTGPRFGKHWVYTVIDTVPETSTTDTITGLAPLEGHNYAVRAVDAVGNASAWSPRVFATTLAAPTLTFTYGTQTTGVVESPALHPITINLHSTANPSPEFTLVSGPATMDVDPTTGLVQWTPTVAEIGAHDFTFRADNGVGFTDLTVSFNITPDVPQVSVSSSGSVVAGTLYTAQVNDGSNTNSTYELMAWPDGMTIDGVTGAIQWTPTGAQGGLQPATVRATNAAGVTDYTFNVNVLFTGAVTGEAVSGTELLVPSLSWTAPTGEGSDLVESYFVNGSATWGVGRTEQTHRVSYTVPATETSVVMPDLVTGKAYTMYVTPIDAAGNSGLRNAGTLVVSNPDLPQLRWTVNGSTGGTSVPGVVVAEQPAEVVLTDLNAAPSSMTLVSGPDGLTFNASTNSAQWTPTAAQVTSGYDTTPAIFEAANSVGSVQITVPMRVFFSGTVHNAQASRNGYNASASWDPPTDNATPVASYIVTRHWTFHGSHKGSASYTLPGDVTSFSFTLGPTGAASHKGITIVPVDEFGNYGVSTQRIAFGSYQNDLAPIATDDAYNATEDTPLAVSSLDGLLANDIDTDNTPGVSVLSPQVVSQPANGSVSITSNGGFTYTPDAEFHGTDAFVYRVYDGRYYSDNAIVTITVASVNDAPVALDDYYFADRDTPIAIDAASGVLANDSDADGDSLSVAIIDSPASGTVTLNSDGSFNYTPDAGFGGIDSFTYIATDTLAESRVSTVSIEVSLSPTKFFVVDNTVEKQFEYSADGTPTDEYSLHRGNKGSKGVAASSDGSTVYVMNGNKRVFVYDDTGAYLGRWLAVGPSRVDGIATDDTDIWIVDRKLDTVFHYEGAASLRSGEMEATDSFALHTNNKQGRGITTDGAHIWIVNDVRGKDKVYKYTVDGDYVGRWNIDPANAKPTGITIDPTGASDAVWIVDNLSDSVYQYDGGATHTRRSYTADAVFGLDAANTNPQGIADPPPASKLVPRAIASLLSDRSELPAQDGRSNSNLWIDAVPNTLVGQNGLADSTDSLVLGDRPMAASGPSASNATRLLEQDAHQQAETWESCVDECLGRWTEIEPSLDDTSFDSGDEAGTLRLSLANDA